jgi:DNA polymerase III delta prime subunit
MSRRIQVEGHANLVRDANSGAIINTSTSEYITYMNIQRKKSEEKSKMMSMCDELNSLKDEMSDIKIMLRQILEK